jgi:hypothetical protein
MKSGNLGAVTTATGAVFGPQALTTTSATHTSRVSLTEAVPALQACRAEALAEAGIRKILA